jgi:hypothetical protein
VEARARGDRKNSAPIEEEWGPAEYAWAGAKLLFAFSPILVVGYVAFFSNEVMHDIYKLTIIIIIII